MAEQRERIVEEGSLFSQFAQTADAVGATTKRLEKLAILDGYLSSLSDDDLLIACRLLAGSPFSLSDFRTLNVGYSVASGALVQLSGIAPEEYHMLALQLGDIGDVAERIMPEQPLIAGDPITLQEAQAAFEE